MLATQGVSTTTPTATVPAATATQATTTTPTAAVQVATPAQQAAAQYTATTVGTAPIPEAINPALNSPSSFDAPINIPFIALTLPLI